MRSEGDGNPVGQRIKPPVCADRHVEHLLVTGEYGRSWTMRENRAKDFFVAFDFSADALRKIDACFRRSGKVLVPLSVREILHEEIARKPA